MLFSRLIKIYVQLADVIMRSFLFRRIATISLLIFRKKSIIFHWGKFKQSKTSFCVLGLMQSVTTAHTMGSVCMTVLMENGGYQESEYLSLLYVITYLGKIRFVLKLFMHIFRMRLQSSS